MKADCQSLDKQNFGRYFDKKGTIARVDSKLMEMSFFLSFQQWVPIFVIASSDVDPSTCAA